MNVDNKTKNLMIMKNKGIYALECVIKKPNVDHRDDLSFGGERHTGDSISPKSTVFIT